MGKPIFKAFKAIGRALGHPVPIFMPDWMSEERKNLIRSLGALKVLNGLGPEATVVTVFPDDNKKYMSTDLLREEPSRPDLLSSEVRLLSYRAFKRVCHTCCVPGDCVEAQAHDLLGEEPLPPCPRRWKSA